MPSKTATDDAKLNRTTITPAPGAMSDAATDAPKRRKRDGKRDGTARARSPRRERAELSSARPPYPGASVMRLAMACLLFLLCLITIAGAILMLLLWQQHRDAGVLTTQVDRTWELFGHLRSIERLVAFAVVPIAVAWAVLATLNVRRATGQRRNPIVAGGSILVGVAGVWFVGRELVAPAADWVGTATGIALQAVFVAVPLLALERVAEASESRRRPLRATAILTIVSLALLQTLGGVSTTVATGDSDRWGMLGAYLVIGGLVQALAALAANEAARAIEEGTQHRYDLRNRFGESVLMQAGIQP